MSAAPSLADVISVLDGQYPPETAEPWDAIGLVCGDPTRAVRRVMFAVDPDPRVVADALERDTDLLVTHHPLLLRGVHGVPTTTSKGRIVTDLIEGRCALFTAHTNADVASGGVNDALADLLGLVERRPLSVHPEGTVGLGRVGRLASPTTLQVFAQRVADALPKTAAGVRVAGDPQRSVRVVAVCGGAGDDLLLEATAAGADVYVTADLRHHLASEHLIEGAPALIDPGHFASEWPWLPVAARRLAEALKASGTTVETHVSALVTDPWTSRVSSNSKEQP